MPEVLIALATGLTPSASARARSFIRLSTFIGVSSLCSSGAWAAWRISSSNTARGEGAALQTMSHCVASGSGMYSEACRPSRRKCGRPLPYLSTAIMLAQLESYLGSCATAAGSGAVKTASHSRQRSRCTR